MQIIGPNDPANTSYEEAWDKAPAMPKSGAGRKPSQGFNPAALVAALNGDFKNALVASRPGGIEAQEAAGQQDFVAGKSLPRVIRGVTHAQLETIGFKFGDNLDDLFVSVELPNGWSLKATNHSMHNELIDATGVVRASIFYKAAFYDRRATMSMCRRYNWYSEYLDGMRQVHVLDAKMKAKVFQTQVCAEDDFKSGDAQDAEAKEWLDREFPRHQEALAYWDDK